MARPFYPVKLLRLGRASIGVFAELPRVGLVPADEQHGTGRDGLDVVEGVEIHKLDVAGQGRVSRQRGTAAFRSKLTARRAVEIVELTIGVRLSH